jgi:hypothetical protein
VQQVGCDGDTITRKPRSSTLDGSSSQSRPTLTDDERIVVLLSAKDPLTSISPGWSYGSRISAWLFGERVNPFANPRLEALRRYAVILRSKGFVSSDEQLRFQAAGFDDRAAAAVEDMVAALRTRSNKTLHCIAWATVLLIAFVSYYLVTEAVEQPLVGLLSAGLAIVLGAPVLVPRDL